MAETSRASILLIYTGGTIGMKTNPETGALSPFDFNDMYEEFPYLRMLNVDISVLHFKPIDSSNVTPALWIELARLIRDSYASFDGFVVLHGTDTMAYSASALSFMIENLGKPVVFTGSQIPIGVLRTDGRENLITAIEIAAAKEEGRAVVAEVCIYFQNKLFRANRTTKHSAELLNAFRSDNYPALADVGVNIHYNEPFIRRAEEDSAPLRIATALETGIEIVKIFPGMRPETLGAMLRIPGVRGVVLETYGAGNAPTADWFVRAVSRAVERGTVVLNVTQCQGGSVSMDMYETGRGRGGSSALFLACDSILRAYGSDAYFVLSGVWPCGCLPETVIPVGDAGKRLVHAFRTFLYGIPIICGGNVRFSSVRSEALSRT